MLTKVVLETVAASHKHGNLLVPDKQVVCQHVIQ